MYSEPVLVKLACRTAEGDVITRVKTWRGENLENVMQTWCTVNEMQMKDVLFLFDRIALEPDETIDRLALWPNIVIQVLPYDAMTGELYEDFWEVEDPILSTEIRQQQQQQRQVTVHSDGTHVIEEQLPRATGSKSLGGYMAPVFEGRPV